MSESLLIPMFPLNLLPLPGELVPLHIFEPRYKQLLNDAEANDITFGIFFSHECNRLRLGSLVKLERVIKRYPGGEADIVVRCIDIFSMDKLYRTYKSRLYPGGDIRNWQVNLGAMPGAGLYELFVSFQQKRKIRKQFAALNLYQVAAELSLDLTDRYKLVTLPEDKREQFIFRQLEFQLHVIRQEEISRDVFHLN